MSRFQLRKLRELFAPLVQIVTFVVISSLVMSLVVLILALLLRSSRTDTNLMVAGMALLVALWVTGALDLIPAPFPLLMFVVVLLVAL